MSPQNYSMLQICIICSWSSCLGQRHYCSIQNGLMAKSARTSRRPIWVRIMEGLHLLSGL